MKGPVPPDTVTSPFVSKHAVKAVQEFTTILKLFDPHANVYVIVCTPVPATAGSKLPAASTPVPLQVPPGVFGVNRTAASVTHKVSTGQTLASQQTKAN